MKSNKYNLPIGSQNILAFYENEVDFDTVCEYCGCSKMDNISCCGENHFHEVVIVGENEDQYPLSDVYVLSAKEELVVTGDYGYSYIVQRYL